MSAPDPPPSPAEPASYLDGGGPDGGRIPFQYRGRPAPAEPERMRARDLALILGGTLALQLVALGHLDGYRLADSVEYLDRAEQVASGEPLDPGTIRSFAFSALLMPFFWIADLLGVEDGRSIVAWVRATQIALGLAAVAVTGRLATQHFGRAAGIGAAVFLGANPVFLQYSVEPLAGTPALLCFTLGLERLLTRGGLVRGFVGGMWLGLSFLLAFKILPTIGVVFAIVWLRDRWLPSRLLVGALGALLVAVLAQCTLDQVVYGSFGSSLLPYLGENIGGVLATILMELGMPEAAGRAYDALGGGSSDRQVIQDLSYKSLTPKDWYLTELTVQFASWAGLGLVVLGTLARVLRPRWAGTACLLALVVTVGLFSTKGSKSFRLWMPFLSLVAVLGGAGVAALVRGALPRGLGRAIAAFALISYAVGGARILLETNTQQYGGYWEAIERVNAAAEGAEERPRVASAYHWAVKYRDDPERIELVKLPHHLDQWRVLEQEQRHETVVALSELDGFVGHLQSITQDAALVDVANRTFEIVDLIYDPLSFEELGPLAILRRRDPGRPPGEARSFFEVFEGVDPGPYQAAIQHPVSVDFRNVDPTTGEVAQLVFLGWDVETGWGDDEVGFLHFHWYVGPTGDHDFTAVYRLTDGYFTRGDRGRGWRLFQGNSRIAHGVRTTSSIPEGSIVRETHVFDLKWYAGGWWSRGEQIPAQLFLEVVEFEETEEGLQRRGALLPHHPSAFLPYRKEPGPLGGPTSPEGRLWSADGLLHVGGTFLPVPPRHAIPDDGRPITAAR